MKSLLVLSAIVVMFTSCNHHSKEIFYFNDNLDFFVIIYGVECGHELDKNAKGEWEYYIPDDGILILKNEREKGGVINMESYKKIDKKYHLHCKITPYSKDFGEPRGIPMMVEYSPRPNYICEEIKEKLIFDVYVYVINNSDDIDERINLIIESTLFGRL